MKYIHNPVTNKDYKIVPHSSKFKKGEQIKGIWDYSKTVFTDR